MSTSETVRVAVQGGTPGADSNNYILFESATAFTGGLRSHDISRMTFVVENSNSGTLRFYKSENRGVTYDQVGGDISVAASGAGDVSGPYDYILDPYDDVKLVWANGGSAQTTWRPGMTLIRGDRNPGK